MQSKIVEIGSKAEKSFRLHAAEQLRLTWKEMEHKVHVAKFIWAEFDPKDSSVFLSKSKNSN
jgi:exonuclease SbcC